MAAVETLSVVLPPDMAAVVRDAVNAGEYASTSEAIGDAVRAWKARRDLLSFRVEELRALVQDGIGRVPNVHRSMAVAAVGAR